MERKKWIWERGRDMAMRSESREEKQSEERGARSEGAPEEGMGRERNSVAAKEKEMRLKRNLSGNSFADSPYDTCLPC